MRKDKQKVIDEEWDEDRVRGFLVPRPGDGPEADHRLLLRAYQSMRASDFERFVSLFAEAGHDLEAPGPDGRTVLEEIREHRYGAPYAAVIEAALAAS